MPVLIQNVEGKILDNLTDDVKAIQFVNAEFGYEDWFVIGYLEVFLQNFKNVLESEDLNKTRDFGLTVNRNKEFIELEISY